MKQTIHAYLGSREFSFEYEAYHLLSRYLRAVRGHRGAPDGSTVPDETEQRLCAYLRERVEAGEVPVTYALAVEAIRQVSGNPTFDPVAFSVSHPGGEAPHREEPKRQLYRDPRHALLGGVLAGLARHFSLDVALVRILFLLLSLFGGAPFLLVLYFLMWVVLTPPPLDSEGGNDPIQGDPSQPKKKDADHLWIVLAAVLGFFLLAGLISFLGSRWGWIDHWGGFRSLWDNFCWHSWDDFSTESGGYFGLVGLVLLALFILFVVLGGVFFVFVALPFWLIVKSDFPTPTKVLLICLLPLVLLLLLAL